MFEVCTSKWALFRPYPRGQRFQQWQNDVREASLESGCCLKVKSGGKWKWYRHLKVVISKRERGEKAMWRWDTKSKGKTSGVGEWKTWEDSIEMSLIVSWGSHWGKTGLGPRNISVRESPGSPGRKKTRQRESPKVVWDNWSRRYIPGRSSIWSEFFRR